MRRPYYVYDANLRYVGREWIDLDDPWAYKRVVLESEIGGQDVTQRSIEKNRVANQFRRAHTDAGVFPSGEHPLERRQR